MGWKSNIIPHSLPEQGFRELSYFSKIYLFETPEATVKVLTEPIKSYRVHYEFKVCMEKTDQMYKQTVAITFLIIACVVFNEFLSRVAWYFSNQ